MAKKGAHRTIYVYADWVSLGQPTLMGLLHSTLLRGKEIFSFEYEESSYSGVLPIRCNISGPIIEVI